MLPKDLFPVAVTDTMSRLFFGAMSAAGMQLSTAEDPEQASRELETVLTFFLEGARQQIGAASAALRGDSPTS